MFIESLLVNPGIECGYRQFTSKPWNGICVFNSLLVSLNCITYSYLGLELLLVISTLL